MLKFLRLLIFILASALPLWGVDENKQAEELKGLIDQRRADIIQRAPAEDQDALKDDVKWGLHTSLYTETFKSLPVTVDREIMKKAAADAAELILRGSSMMRNEDELKAYVERKMPALKKSISAKPLDDSTVKAALNKLTETMRAIERIMVSSTAKVRIETNNGHFPDYVKTRADHFSRGRPRDSNKILEWSVREYTVETINNAVNHQLTGESNSMGNFWYVNAIAEGWLKTSTKTEDEIRAFVAPLLFDGKADQAEPTLVINNQFEQKMLNVFRKTVYYVTDIK